MKNSTSAQPTLNGVTLARGTDAIAAIGAVARRIRDPHLRQFFNAVTAEPEIHLALTTPVTAAQRSEAEYGYIEAPDNIPIHVLERAASIAGLWCVQRPLVHDVLYVATFVRGVRQLIQSYICPGANLDDLLFTLIRPALHRLDDQHAEAAWLLRNVLDWGNGDDLPDSFTRQIHHAAMYGCQLLRAEVTSVSTARPFARSRASTGKRQYRQVKKLRRELACGGRDREQAL